MTLNREVNAMVPDEPGSDEPSPDGSAVPGGPVLLPPDPPMVAQAPGPPGVEEPPGLPALDGPPPYPTPAGPPPHPEILAHNAPLAAAAAAGPTRKAGRRGLALGLTAAGVAGGGLLVKFVLGFVAAGVVGGAVGLFFGGPFEHLPADQRQQFEQRLEAALGDSLDGKDEAAQVARIEELLVAGLVRLDDALLVERLGLYVQMLERSDPATCAAIARYGGTGAIEDAVSDKALKSLEIASLGRWFDINITAIEAEIRGAPPARAADEAAVDQIFTTLLPTLSEPTTTTLISMSNGTDVTDGAACSAYRELYGLVLVLPPGDAAVMALYDVAP